MILLSYGLDTLSISFSPKQQKCVSFLITDREWKAFLSYPARQHYESSVGGVSFAFSFLELKLNIIPNIQNLCVSYHVNNSYLSMASCNQKFLLNMHGMTFRVPDSENKWRNEDLVKQMRNERNIRNAS